jgi:hypothetical protein
VADQKITQLSALAQADVQAAVDVLPVADVSTAETKKITIAAATAAGLAGMPDGVVAAAKLVPGSVTATQLAPGAVGSAQLGASAVLTANLSNQAVTADKIAAGAVGATHIANGAVGSAQLADGGISTADLADGSVTTPKLSNAAVDGTKLAAGAVATTHLVDGSVTTAKVADGAITDAKITGPLGLGKLGTQAPNVVLAGPATGATSANATFRTLQSADLPIGSATARGAVSAPSGGGLTISGSGGLSIDNTVVAGSSSVITYNTRGLVTGGRSLTVGDLPTSGVVAGTYTKVTVDAHGVVTGSAALTAADIPDLDASKIATGMIPGLHIADRSITQQKLADHAISYIQEAAPSSIPGDHPIGELWFQESSARLSMWNGNSWMAVGQGSLSNENLRFCGTFNATTGVVTAVTQFGTTAGLAAAAAIPAAVNTLTGVYLVCDTAGTFSGKTYDPGDWVLCMGQARGWERIDTLSGGGGGGVSALDALTDVTITTPSNGDVLRYNGTRWVNSMANLDPGSY